MFNVAPADLDRFTIAELRANVNNHDRARPCTFIVGQLQHERSPVSITQRIQDFHIGEACDPVDKVARCGSLNGIAAQLSLPSTSTSCLAQRGRPSPNATQNQGAHDPLPKLRFRNQQCP